MVYHRSDGGGSSSADAAPRRHSESSRGSARDEEDRPREDSKYSNDRSRSNSRHKDGRCSEGSRSRNGKDDGKYSDGSRYTKDSRSRDGREEGKHHDRSREGRDEGSSRYSDGRYAEGPRYGSAGSRYGGNGENWYSEGSRHRDDSRYYGGGSSRYHAEDGYDPADREDEGASATSEQEKLKNVFQNDGSFLEMFKKMQEASKVTVDAAADSPKLEPSSAEAETCVKQEPMPRPTTATAPKRGGMAAGIVGKRRGGRVLPTGMVKKQKKEEEEEETPKDAWSLYMAEVRKYKEASCEEEGKTRPLVK